jgi:hypothetical protein
MGLLTKLLRIERPPAGALAVLEGDERLTAWGLTPDGEAVLATTHGLWLPGGERLDWHLIHKAIWDRGVLQLVPSVEVLAADETGGVVADGPLRSVALEQPRDIPDEVRTRVTRSVAYSTYHQLPGGGVRVVARRVPGQDGLTWVLRFDPGVDLTDPEVRAAADGYLAQARALADVSY